MDETKIEPFDVDTASDELWDMFFELNEALHNEAHPDEDDPPMARPLMRRYMSSHDPNRGRERWCVLNEQRDQMLGFGMLIYSPENSPEYEQNKHVVTGWVRVIPAARRRGIASTLTKTLVAHALARNATVMEAFSLIDCGHAFNESLGGKLAIEAAENRLKLSEVDWSMIEQWAAQGPIRAPGVTLEMFQDVPEADIEPYSKLYTEAMNAQPMGELETRHVTTPETRREQEARTKKIGFEWHTKISREPDGTISGLTEIGFAPEDPRKAQQMLTGVDPKYRGRGLGKWLKADMLLFVRDHLPQIKTIATGNADVNAPMLSINERMGFKRHVGERVYKFQIADLRAKLDVE